MVESVGFEPTGHVTTPDDLANRCLRPLSQLSLLGGRGETRTHTPIAEPSVFKTAAAMPIRLTLPYLVLLAGTDPTSRSYQGRVLPLYYRSLVVVEGFEPPIFRV